MFYHTPQDIRVCIDVGCKSHQVAVGLSTGEVIDEFSISHLPEGFRTFFAKLEHLEQQYQCPVRVAMEGYNGYARPLDSMVLARGWQLYNINNLKLARFKEIFPGAAKTDVIDARRGLELFQLMDHLPTAKDVLQVVAEPPRENQMLKRLSRRRRRLVNERVRVVNNLQADLQAVCPSLLALTGDADNLWFLQLLTHTDNLRKLSRLHLKTLRKIPGIGAAYASRILQWQKQAQFSAETEWVGEMIQQDAARILELHAQIKALEAKMAVTKTTNKILWCAAQRTQTQRVPISRAPLLAVDAAAAQSTARCGLDTHESPGRPLAPTAANPASVPATASARHDLRQEPGAGNPLAGICGGGCRVTGIPTATPCSWTLFMRGEQREAAARRLSRFPLEQTRNGNFNCRWPGKIVDVDHAAYNWKFFRQPY